MKTTMLADARAEALFCCDLSTAEPLTKAQATAAIRGAVRTRGGVRGCACEVAQEYGDHPREAAARMRWATSTVANLFATPARDVFWNRQVAA